MAKKDEAEKKAKEEEKDEEKGGKSTLLLLIIVVLLLSNVGITAVLFLGSDSEAEEAPSEELGPTTPLLPFVINLDEPRADRYLRVSIALEIDEEADMELIELRKPIIRHRFIAYLSSQQIATLRSQESKDKVQQDLTKIAQEILTDRMVRNIYFTEFIIQ